MDHSSHTRLATTELTSDILVGATIYGVDDQKVGTVSHIHGSGATAQAVIDVGGFLGLGAKPVAVSLSELQFMRDSDGQVHAETSWTKEQLEEMPEHHH